MVRILAQALKMDAYINNSPDSLSCQWCEAQIPSGDIYFLCAAVACQKVLCIDCKEIDFGESFCYACLDLVAVRTPPESSAAADRALSPTCPTPPSSVEEGGAAGEEESEFDEPENREESPEF